MSKNKVLLIAVMFLIIFLLVESCSRNKNSDFIYQSFAHIGQKENKIIFIVGRRRQLSNQCNSCEENKNFDSWKGLHRILRNYENVEFIIYWPRKLGEGMPSIPSDSIKYFESKEPEKDIFLVVKQGKILFEYKGLLDMQTIRYIFDLIKE